MLKRSPRARVSLAVALVLSVGVVACSGDSDGAADQVPTTAISTTTEPPSTTAAPTSATTEPIPTGPIAPLTGLVETETDLERPALAVKIDNHPDAGPPVGIEEADIVFESRAEGVTRYMAVFHSHTPEEVGPVRSSRTTDYALLSALDTPLYASSGGNSGVLGGLRRLPIIAVTAASENVYYRSGSHTAPHNLFVDPSDLYALAPEERTGPEPWFEYRTSDTPLPATAEPITGAVTVDFRGSPLATFTWDESLMGWARTQNGRDDVADSGVRIAPPNVVIMEASYKSSSADPRSPELVSTGAGDLYVLTDGAVIEGTWQRAKASDKPTLVDTAGDPILLTPGQTWVLYPEVGRVTLP